MSLSDDEKMYFDEKFRNINDKLVVLKDFGKRINALEIGMEKRPTIVQIIMVCGFFLGLGITLGAALF